VLQGGGGQITVGGGTSVSSKDFEIRLCRGEKGKKLEKEDEPTLVRGEKRKGADCLNWVKGKKRRRNKRILS